MVENLPFITGENNCSCPVESVRFSRLLQYQDGCSATVSVHNCSRIVQKTAMDQKDGYLAGIGSFSAQTLFLRILRRTMFARARILIESIDVKKIHFQQKKRLFSVHAFFQDSAAGPIKQLCQIIQNFIQLSLLETFPNKKLTEIKSFFPGTLPQLSL